MRAPTLAWLLAAAPLAAQVSPGERAALDSLAEDHATTFELIDSWYAGRPIRYYHFGRDTGRPGLLYRVRGGSDVVTSLPGQDGYSALRVVFVVQPASGVEAQALRSHLEIERLARLGLARIIGPGTVINAPIVPQGSQLERDPAQRAVRGAWYKGYRVSYYELGPTPAVPIPLMAFISGFDESGEAVLVDGQPTNASAVPGVPGYSDMWRIRFAQVQERFKPGSYRDYGRALADAQAGRMTLIDPGFLVNCPVMYVDGKAAAR